jgi:hypothetical protein
MSSLFQNKFSLAFTDYSLSLLKRAANRESLCQEYLPDSFGFKIRDIYIISVYINLHFKPPLCLYVSSALMFKSKVLPFTPRVYIFSILRYKITSRNNINRLCIVIQTGFYAVRIEVLDIILINCNLRQITESQN